MAQEAKIEQYLSAQIKRRHGLALKWVSPSNVGVPDRLVIYPQGNIFAVEVKAPKGKVSPVQVVMHERLRKMGMRVHVVYSKEEIDDVITTEEALNAITVPASCLGVPTVPSEGSAVHGHGTGQDSGGAVSLEALLD
jgi:hypothetical protein